MLDCAVLRQFFPEIFPGKEFPTMEPELPDMNDLHAATVPLAEQLRSVPRDSVLRIDTTNALGCMDTRSIPVGRLCHEAADALGVTASPATQPHDWREGLGYWQCKRCGIVSQSGQENACTGGVPDPWPQGWDGRDKEGFQRALGMGVVPAPQRPVIFCAGPHHEACPECVKAGRCAIAERRSHP